MATLMATSCIALDVDAGAFISAAGITDNTQKYAIDRLVRAAKANGWWSLCDAIYPMVGGTSTTCKFNLKDPRDADAAYRLTFTGGWTYSANGITGDGFSGYARTYYTPTSANDIHISAYAGDANAGTADCMIGGETIGGYCTRILKFSGDYYMEANNLYTGANFTYTAHNGFFITSRTVSTDYKNYRRTTNIASPVITSSLSNIELFIGAEDKFGAPDYYSSRLISFITIGKGISSVIEALMYTDIQNFQIALNRAVTIDTDALAFVAAAGIVDATQETAINNLVVSAKTNGWWSKCAAIYPFVGGTATSHKFNLKDPRDLDAAYRLTFPNGATHSANGVDWDGVNQYANTQLSPSAVLGLRDSHIGYYCRENVASALEWEMGCYGSHYLRLVLKFQDGNTYADCNTSAGGTNMVSDTRGWFMTNREPASNTQNKAYKNGYQIRSSNDDALSIPTATVLIGANWDGAVFSGYSTKQCAFATIGNGLTFLQQALMYKDIQAFQTALGRQV